MVEGIPSGGYYLVRSSWSKVHRYFRLIKNATHNWMAYKNKNAGETLLTPALTLVDIARKN